MRLEAAILEVTSLVIHKQILRRREANGDQFYLEITLHFPIIITNCEKLFSSMSATPLYIKDGHTNMAAVSFSYACQMRDPVN